SSSSSPYSSARRSAHLAEHLDDTDEECLGLMPFSLGGNDSEQSDHIQDGATFPIAEPRAMPRNLARSADPGLRLLPSATFKGMDIAARRNCSARGAWPRGSFSVIRRAAAKNSIER